MKKTLGLIGFGQFGRLAASLLSGRFDVVVHDAAGLRETIEGLGLRAGSLEEAAASEVSPDLFDQTY